MKIIDVHVHCGNTPRKSGKAYTRKYMMKIASLHGPLVFALSCMLAVYCQAGENGGTLRPNSKRHGVQLMGGRSAASTSSATAPNWAKHAYDALQSYKVIVDYWVGRVAENTERDYFDVHGGWNDDVELAQSLTPYWLLTGDEPLAEMFKDMADKIQEAPAPPKSPPRNQPGDRRIEQGFSAARCDVEHASEEVTLVFPRLFYVDYGEPRVIELMVRCIWNFEDNMDERFPGEENWAQRVPTGMLMRSPWYNARIVRWNWPWLKRARPDLKNPIKPQDVVQNFRTTAPGLSVAWYYGTGHYFWQEGPHGFMKEHHDAWMEACLRTDEGKPKYIPPAKILVPSLAFGDWTVSGDNCGSQWNMVWSFRHFYNHMAADWLMFRNHPDPELASFAATASRIVQEAYHYRQTGKKVAGKSISFDRNLLLWRAETKYTGGEDDILLKTRTTKNADTRMTAYVIHLQRGELAKAVSQAEQGFLALKEYLKPKETEWTTHLTPTSAGLTDRVKFHSSDPWLVAAVGGGGVYDAAYPSMYFSWNDTDAKVVSLVLEKDSRDVAFWAYNFGPEKEVGIRLWRFSKGLGSLSIGADSNADGKVDSTLKVIEIPNVVKGGEVRFLLPSRRLQLVRIRVVQPRPRDLSQLADPAIGRHDYTHTGNTAKVVVHNLGLKATGNFKVYLLSTAGDSIGTAQTVALAGFTGMTPVTKTLSWRVPNPRDVGWVIIDLEDSVEEMTELNNKLDVRKSAATAANSTE